GKYLDGLAPEHISAFEAGLYAHMDAQYPEVGQSVRDTGALSPDAEAKLKKGIEEYMKDFTQEAGL
ncbi:MAG: hypothetical protein LBD12_05135, partial [Clostridiales Family XIII bacterium]|nr:hypothetical protein [Clostridiales Family XIII bacterium]